MINNLILNKLKGLIEVDKLLDLLIVSGYNYTTLDIRTTKFTLDCKGNESVNRDMLYAIDSIVKLRLRFKCLEFNNNSIRIGFKPAIQHPNTGSVLNGELGTRISVSPSDFDLIRDGGEEVEPIIWINLSEITNLTSGGGSTIKIDLQSRLDSILHFLFQTIISADKNNIKFSEISTVKCIKSKGTSLVRNQEYPLIEIKDDLIKVRQGIRERFYNSNRFKIS